MKHIYARYWRLYIGATSNAVKIRTEAASPGGEGQGLSRLSEEIVRYLSRISSIPLYKTSAAKRQAREAGCYFLQVPSK